MTMMSTEWVEDFAGFCAVCLDELGTDRTVAYCGQKCRGILRAWGRLDTVEGFGEQHRKRKELRAALEARRLPVAAKAGMSLSELYTDRCERANGLEPGSIERMLTAPGAPA